MTFSIIVPVYNTARYLPQCLDSILSQSFVDFEVICVNDGSTDDSLDVLQAYAERDERIRAVSIPNSGVSHARNVALDVAQGDYLLFVDSDDWLVDGALDRIYRAVSANICDFLIYNFKHYFEPENRFEDNLSAPSASYESGMACYNACAGLAWFGAVCRLVVSSSIIHRYHLRFNESIDHFEDMMFTIDLCVLAELSMNLPDTLYVYRRFREGSQMSTNGQKRFMDMVSFANILSERYLFRRDVDKSVLYKTLSAYYRNSIKWSPKGIRNDIYSAVNWHNYYVVSSISLKNRIAYWVLRCLKRFV